MLEWAWRRADRVGVGAKEDRTDGVGGVWRGQMEYVP